jgi:hypothetical protein
MMGVLERTKKPCFRWKAGFFTDEDVILFAELGWLPFGTAITKGNLDATVIINATERRSA